MRTSATRRRNNEKRSRLCIFEYSIGLEFLNSTTRHPPRAFPLGLLAPRCLCACVVCSANRTSLFGGRKESSPQLRDSSSQWFAEFTALLDFCFLLMSVTSFNVPSESALAQPPSSFSIQMLWCRFRYEGK